MTEPPPSIELSGFGSSLKLFGATAPVVFLLIMQAFNIAVALYEHGLRNAEHAQIACGNKLAIFIFTSPRSEKGTLEISWERLPVDLYGCLPKFLFDRKP